MTASTLIIVLLLIMLLRNHTFLLFVYYMQSFLSVITATCIARLQSIRLWYIFLVHTLTRKLEKGTTHMRCTFSSLLLVLNQNHSICNHCCFQCYISYFIDIHSFNQLIGSAICCLLEQISSLSCMVIANIYMHSDTKS